MPAVLRVLAAAILVLCSAGLALSDPLATWIDGTAMPQWTSAGKGPRFGLIVHHTDAAREYAYDRNSSPGRLDTALDMAAGEGWVVVVMKNDWKTIFSAAK